VRLSERILKRSGELVFDETFAASLPPCEERRIGWIAKWLEGGIKGLSVVDIGCWTGGCLVEADRLGARELLGIDLPGPWLEKAQANLPHARLIASPGLAEVPNEMQDRFDLALLLETLEHVPRGSEPAILRNITKLLRPGGTLVLATPAAGLPALSDPAWWLVGHRHYSARKIYDLAGVAGLVVAGSRYSGNTQDCGATIASHFGNWST